MNREEAQEYAKTMSYKEAVLNCIHSKGIAYRKASLIKLRELAEIADKLERDNDMTREEAVDILVGVIETHSEEENEALDMAIEALQNEPTPCEKCIHVKSCRKVIILKNRTYKLIKYCSQGAERKEP